jgi:adenylate cyclase
MNIFKRNYKVLFLSSFILLLVIIFLYIFYPFERVNNVFIDKVFQNRGPIPTQDQIVIVDIDEKSLKNIGQWPWSRNVISDLILKISDAQATIIGLDIIFAEEDNTSPEKIIKKLNLKVSKNIMVNYDTILANTLTKTPTILSYGMIMENDNLKNEDNDINLAGIFIEKNKPTEEYLIQAYRPLLNIPILEENSYSSGFVYAMPDTSGMIRKSPLIMKFNNEIFPSLSLEMIRLAYGIPSVIALYDEFGIKNIDMGSFTIPVDRSGQLYINFRGPAKTFPYISALDILNNNFDSNIFKDKIVLVGTSAMGLNDIKATTYDEVFPGVEVHANIIDNIIAGDFISKPSYLLIVEILIIIFIIITLTLFMSLEYIQVLGSLFISIVYLFIAIYLINYYLFTEGILINILWIINSIIFTYITLSIINYMSEYKQKEQIKGLFANKVSDAVMKEIISNGEVNESNQSVTIFFSDIRSFSTITESINNTKKLKHIMNMYFNKVSQSIINTNGTLDKFIGDAVMAYWNAPIKVDNHPFVAFKAAVDQIKILDNTDDELHTKLQEYQKVIKVNQMKIGIGLHTGHDVMVGNLGSDLRSDYTILGDDVNIAARIESLCKTYDAKILLSNITYNAIFENKNINTLIKNERYTSIENMESLDNLTNKDIIIRHLDEVVVKGKDEPIGIYEALTIWDIKEIELFRVSYYNYNIAEFKKAIVYFCDLKEYKELINQPTEREKEFIERCEILFDIKNKLNKNTNLSTRENIIWEKYYNYKAWSFDKK